METYIIHQDGAGDYEIEADSEEEALYQMACDIVKNFDGDRELACGTDNFEEQVEFTLKTLSIVEEE